MDLLIRTVDEEDFPVCLDIQRGLGSGAQTHITFGRNEPALAHYHRNIQEAVGWPRSRTKSEQDYTSQCA
jgi:hypothetical protein